MNREELHQRFQEIFGKLNPEQQEAVQTVYGPVMVIAGPGTGKTQILSARIGHLLLETDYLPDNILCLTYTDAGRIAMRKRLQDMIGADAYRVAIHTFHSFCSQIISDNPSFFNKPALDPVSELERVEILKDLIDKLENDNPLKRFKSRPYLEVKNLIYFISSMKREGWTKAYMLQAIEEHIESLPEQDGFVYKRKTTDKKTGKVYVKGDLNEKKIATEVARFDKTKAAIHLFDDYQVEMDKRNRFDFDDMINWVLAAFKKDADFLADFKEQYQFVLVDEFQDTSGTQNALINALVEDEDQPNIFVVGDDDQSIYRFQGANIQNIYDFKDRYTKNLKEVVLARNYRSSPAILESAKHLIKNNSKRLALSDSLYQKELISSHEEISKITAEPKIQFYANPFQEWVGVAEEIQRLIESGEEANEIAVIYRVHRLGDEFLAYLKHKNIPYYVKRKENLFEIPLAKKILQILSYIASEREVLGSGERLLFEILHSDLYQVPAHEIVRINARMDADEEIPRWDKKMRVYLKDCLEKKDQSFSAELTELATKLESWIKKSYNVPLLELVELILREGNFLQFALKDGDKLWHMEVLRAVMDYAKEEMHRNQNHSIESFVNTIDTMQDQDLNISLNRIYGNDQGVNMLSAHGAKGLEFKHVFMVHTTSQEWESKRAPSSGYKIPVGRSTDTDDLNKNEDLRRLFYVAVTRAKINLYISWPQTNMDGKALAASQFIAEITDGTKYKAQKIEFSEEVMERYLEIYLFANKQPVIETAERDFIEHQLKNFTLSPTALNNFINCPLRFYYSNVVKVPAGRNEYMAFGSAIHHALEHCFKKMQDHPEQEFPPLEEVLKDYDWYLHRNKEAFSPEALKRRAVYGAKILTDYYTENVDSWNKVVSIEKRYKNIVIDHVPLNGMIDKIEFDGKDAVVLDYKTGKSEAREIKKKVSPPTEDEPQGSDYWRQAMFYKLLVDNDPFKDWTVKECIFQFVEPDKAGKYHLEKIVPTPEYVKMVREQIKEVWNKIQNHDFYKGCGEEHCDYCNFVKESNRYVELVPLEEEENAD